MFRNIWYQIGRSVVNLYVRKMMRADIHQDAPFPKGAKIIAVNHPTTNDPAFITTLSSEHMTILIKETVFKVPLFGRSLRLAGHVPVVAGSGCEALEAGIRLLRAGRTVMIFPEGEISPSGGFKKPHTGVARLALATGVPVVPVGISLDSNRVRQVVSKIDGEMEPSAWYLRGPYAMTVGEPVTFTGSMDDREHVRQVAGQIMQHVMILSRRGDARIAARIAVHSGKRARAAAPRLAPRVALPRLLAPQLSTATPTTALRLAWKGTWLGFQQSARLFANTSAFRLAESLLVFVLMFARQLVR